jgi:hypothetical protein
MISAHIVDNSAVMDASGSPQTKGKTQNPIKASKGPPAETASSMPAGVPVHSGVHKILKKGWGRRKKTKNA